MDNKKLCNIIAYINLVIAAIYCVFFLIGIVTNFSLMGLIGGILMYGGFLAACVLLVIGLRSDRQFYIMPWLVVTAIVCIMNIVVVVQSFSVILLILTVIVIASWFPIFKYSRQLDSSSLPT
ncbi:uncharacterized protein LOC142238511 [Haematobia irritans]|uniref:Uncharacterized protein n=1 Tax=Haematobia irritans TaxID=7368 RepID=A0A1L8E7E7_HAEIR